MSDTEFKSVHLNHVLSRSDTCLQCVEAENAQLHQQLKRATETCASVYQWAGANDFPVEILDNLSIVAQGDEAEKTESYHEELPIAVDLNYQLRQQFLDWENREASVCPEDVGFVEYIGVLRQRAETAERCAEARKGIADVLIDKLNAAERERDEARAKCAEMTKWLAWVLDMMEMYESRLIETFGDPAHLVHSLIHEDARKKAKDSMTDNPGQHLLDELKALKERNEVLERVREAAQEIVEGFWRGEWGEGLREALAAVPKKS